MSRFEEAEKMYKQTVSQPLTDDPFQNVWRVLAYVALAKFELDRKNQPAARVYLDRAIQLDPKNPEVLEGLIFVCGQLQDAECVNKYKGALEELKAREEELKKPMQAGSTAEPAPQPGATASPPPPAPAPGPGMTGGGTP